MHPAAGPPLIAPATGPAPAAERGRVAVRGTAELSRRRMRVGQRAQLRLRLRNTGATRSTTTRSCVRLSPRLRVVRRAAGSRLQARLLCFAIPSLAPGERVVRTATLRAVAPAGGAVARDGARDETAISQRRVAITAR